MGPCPPWQHWCIGSLPPYCVPAQTNVSARRTWCNINLRGSIRRSPYHPPPRVCGGYPNVPPPSYLQVSPWSTAVGLLCGLVLRLFHLPLRLVLLPYRICQISGVPPPFALAYPPIPVLKSTTPFYLPFSESTQTPRGPQTPRLLCRSCCRSARTPENFCGYNQSSLTQREDPSQRPCRVAARSSQCEAAKIPSTHRLGSPLPGSPPLASRSFASNDADLVLTWGFVPSGPVACPPLLLIGNPVPWKGGLGFSLPAAGRLRVLQKM